MTQPYKVSAPEITVPSASEGVYSRLIWTIALGIALLASLQAAWALSIGSRQLFKDATDWTYDVLLYGLAAAGRLPGEGHSRLFADFDEHGTGECGWRAGLSG